MAFISGIELQDEIFNEEEISNVEQTDFQRRLESHFDSSDKEYIASAKVLIERIEENAKNL